LIKFFPVIIVIKYWNNKIFKAFPKLNDQNGCIKNGYIGFNIRKIQDIIDYSEHLKAFDSIEWEFMFKSLERFGFQESILSWIKTLYTNIKGCISNNGWISERIAPSM
jgi:hypothetical protein